MAKNIREKFSLFQKLINGGRFDCPKCGKGTGELFVETKEGRRVVYENKEADVSRMGGLRGGSAKDRRFKSGHRKGNALVDIVNLSIGVITTGAWVAKKLSGFKREHYKREQSFIQCSSCNQILWRGDEK